MTKDLYPKYIKNSLCSTVRKKINKQAKHLKEQFAKEKS